MLLLLFILGLIAGSFADALVWRMHTSQNYLTGRSQCDVCGHKLALIDLIPLFSWLIQRGKCRYCGTHITAQHIIMELAGGLIFSLSYLYWPLSLSLPGQRVLFISWIISSIGLLALALYDARWMILPSKIIYPTLLVAVIGRAAYILHWQADKSHAEVLWLGSVVVASGIFWLLFMISRGKWIGYGDVRLGLVTGTLLADPSKSFLMVFFASLLGSLAAGIFLLFKKRGLGARISYGPFLALATFLMVLFGQSLIDWYNRVFLG